MTNDIQTPKDPRRQGTPALLGALLAMTGMVAAANPTNPILRAIGEAAPQLAQAVPTVITSCGAILAAFSSPPRLRGGK